MSRKILFFFFFKQKTAYEISACLVGSEMCIRDSVAAPVIQLAAVAAPHWVAAAGTRYHHPIAWPRIRSDIHLVAARLVGCVRDPVHVRRDSPRGLLRARGGIPARCRTVSRLHQNVEPIASGLFTHEECTAVMQPVRWEPRARSRRDDTRVAAADRPFGDFGAPWTVHRIGDDAAVGTPLRMVAVRIFIGEAASSPIR